MQDHEQIPTPSAKPDHPRYVKAFVKEPGGDRPDRRSSREAERRQAFVRSLQAKIEHKLSTHLDDDVQGEIGKMMRLLVLMPWRVLEENRAFFELAFDALSKDKPNLILVRNLRYELSELNDRAGGWFSRLLARLSGTGALHAVISGLVVVFVLSSVVVILLAMVNRFAGSTLGTLGSDLPLLESISRTTIGQLILLIHAALIGSIVSIMVRLRNLLSVPEFSPLLLFTSVVGRPFISVMFAIFAYVMMKSGIISFLGINLNGDGADYLVWGIGFLCGFSERLAQDFIARASSAFGETADPPNPKTPA